VETLNAEVSGQLIRIVRSSIVALVGVSPYGPAQQPIQCLNETDDAQFGGVVKGASIGRTLDIIRKIAGGGPVIVINVYDAATHNIARTGGSAEVISVTDGVAQMAYAPIGTVTIVNNTTSVAIPGVKGTDWDYDKNGKFTDITGALEGIALKFSYTGFNPAVVTSAHIVGTVDSAGTRTGAKLIETIHSAFGFTAKVLIAPEYSQLSGVAEEMRSQADKSRAMYLHDAPYGTTVAQALAGRGPSGTIGWNHTHERTILLYPYQKAFNPVTGTNDDYPYSAFMAGVIMKSDLDHGYWYSPSNKPMQVVSSAERRITSGVSDASSEANQLNAAGITTYFADFGTGFRTWGNRTAAYPASSSAKNFIPGQRTGDILAESIEQASLKYADQPITSALIDVVKEEGNALLSSLIQRGALIPGSTLTYDPALNPPSQLAAGQIVFTYDWMYPTPAERISFRSVLNINLYRFVNQAAAA
jgi:hypothetical protein